MMRAADVAARLNLRRYPNSWRGCCPCCEYRGQTFSVRAGPNGEAWLYCANGCSRNELNQQVARSTGQPLQAERSNPNDAAKHERKRERALTLWHGSESAVGTLADTYLTKRGLPGLAASSALRFHGDTAHPEGGRLPAMIALVTDVSGKPLGIHRTYLGRDGLKARIEPAKASLGPIWGGAICLQPLKPGAPLLIGEGIETSASAGRLTVLPAWAAISAGNLAKGLRLPLEARVVVIAADPDEPGGNAARDAWYRWTAEGRGVQIATPDGAGDFNDLLRTREVDHA